MFEAAQRADDEEVRSVETVIAELLSRSLIRPDSRITALAGGVSCQVHAISSGSDELVVKWGQARLRTAGRWISDPARTLREAEAIAFVRDRLGPIGVPELVFVVPELNLFAMRRIPTELANWRTALLAGEIEIQVAEAIGEGLARLHSLPVTDAWIADPGDVLRDELRVRPFYEDTARRLPALRSQFDGVIARLQSSDHLRLVHGDASPKNVLIGVDASVNLVDWEVFHLGDVAFDVGMFGAHILCKSVADPTRRQQFSELMERLCLSYTACGGPAAGDAIVAHAGAIALARIYGRSRSDYLHGRARAGVQRLASGLLEMPSGVDQLISAIRTGAGK